MKKKVQLLDNHEQAERLVLEMGFQRSHQERMDWLYTHLEVFEEIDHYVQKSNAYELEKKRG